MILPIYICEDDRRQLESIKKTISEIVNTEGLSKAMNIVCASTDPQDILDHLHKNPIQSIYFIDIDLGNESMNGLDLGVKIRSIDPRGYIVIITVHTEMAVMTFRRKIEAMEFIEKDEPLTMPQRIKDCLIHAYGLYNMIPESQISKKICIICNQIVMAKNINDIIYIEAIAHKAGKIRIHEKDRFDETFMSLRKIRKELDESFYQCHKSYIVNLDHLKEINHGRSVAIMDNGRYVDISTRELKNMERYYIEYLLNK